MRRTAAIMRSLNEPISGGLPKEFRRIVAEFYKLLRGNKVEARRIISALLKSRLMFTPK